MSKWDSTIHSETDKESQNHMEFEIGLSDTNRSERLIVEFFLRKGQLYLSSSFSVNQKGIIGGPEGLVNRNFSAMFHV